MALTDLKKLLPNLSRAMKVEIEGELHVVVYIEYQDGVPVDIKTLSPIMRAPNPYWRLYHWYGFLNENIRAELCLYHHGDGGDENEIDGASWFDEYNGSYWLAEGLKLRGEQTRGRIPSPISFRAGIQRSINPFKVGEIVYNYDHCDRCGWYSVDWCREHQYQDADGALRYKDTNALVD